MLLDETRAKARDWRLAILLIARDAVPAAERLKNVAPGVSPGYACRETPSPGRGERLCAVSFAPTGLSSTPTRSQGLMAAPSLEAARYRACASRRACIRSAHVLRPGLRS